MLDENLNYYRNDRIEMLPFVPESATRILDVGCAYGEFATLLKKRNRNCVVWGVESNSCAASIASQKLDYVINAEFCKEFENLLNSKFDCIVFNDVLEHMSDPWFALSSCKALMNDGGCVVASIPNVRCYSVVKKLVINGDFPYVDSGILDRTHLRFFTRKGIVRLFMECGFDIVRIDGQNSIINSSRLLKLVSCLNLKNTSEFFYTNYAIKAVVV